MSPPAADHALTWLAQGKPAFFGEYSQPLR